MCLRKKNIELTVYRHELGHAYVSVLYKNAIEFSYIEFDKVNLSNIDNGKALAAVNVKFVPEVALADLTAAIVKMFSVLLAGGIVQHLLQGEYKKINERTLELKNDFDRIMLLNGAGCDYDQLYRFVPGTILTQVELIKYLKHYISEVLFYELSDTIVFTGLNAVASYLYEEQVRHISKKELECLISKTDMDSKLDESESIYQKTVSTLSTQNFWWSVLTKSIQQAKQDLKEQLSDV